MQEHPQARFIVNTLRKEGFIAYYAGGWVRDFLLQRESDDIDIATSAPPETIQSLFPHTVPIGLAFGIILVIVEDHQYEVATFRQDFDYQDGRRPAVIAFSTAEEDAKRRDFTINGMFYDPIEQKVLDFVGGQIDLQAKILRAIGNPHERIKEDRLRMIRAARLACRFHFTIDPATQEAIHAHAKELFPAVAVERIWQEFTKGLLFGSLVPMLLMLHDFGLLEIIFPSLQGVKKETIVNRLQPLNDFPKEAPLITQLLELFPNPSLENALALCQKFKLSKQDMQFVSFLFSMKQSVNAPKEQVEPITWAYIYANPLCPICLQILAVHQKEKEAFLQLHAEQKNSLKQAIERIQKATPLVTSHDLMRLGVEPGKKMGLLLKEAERLSINENIQDKEQVLRRLKL
ncbi:MAG: CCA tRNA nucleotidyltransferase [Chlamydiales bacterium]|nr:CCA tRNA nucleotidyltransferase [Chlamydiales bacterium]